MPSLWRIREAKNDDTSRTLSAFSSLGSTKDASLCSNRDSKQRRVEYTTRALCIVTGFLVVWRSLLSLCLSVSLSLVSLGRSCDLMFLAEQQYNHPDSTKRLAAFPYGNRRQPRRTFRAIKCWWYRRYDVCMRDSANSRHCRVSSRWKLGEATGSWNSLSTTREGRAYPATEIENEGGNRSERVPFNHYTDWLVRNAVRLMSHGRGSRFFSTLRTTRRRTPWIVDDTRTSPEIVLLLEEDIQIDEECKSNTYPRD